MVKQSIVACCCTEAREGFRAYGRALVLRI